MTNKEKFINFIQKEVFDHEDIYMEGDAETWEAVKQYWNDFCSVKTAPKAELTENGSKILKYMQETCDKFNNIFKSKEIGEGLFMPSRSVSGSMKKLITEGFVEKIGSDPVAYAITEKGKNKVI